MAQPMCEPGNTILVKTISKELAIQSNPEIARQRAQKLVDLYGGSPPDFKSRAEAAREREAGAHPDYKARVLARRQALEASRTATASGLLASIQQPPGSPSQSMRSSRRSASMTSLLSEPRQKPPTLMSIGSGVKTLAGWAEVEASYPKIR
mmetsp:Transcript_40522/g.111527  ORF Transcript_40522/g.111527 Transcript_40522/m.111527 type:complete len:151 (-) Transcript_40522:16-468(-)